jgi:hypothetical protein
VDNWPDPSFVFKALGKKRYRLTAVGFQRNFEKPFLFSIRDLYYAGGKAIPKLERMRTVLGPVAAAQMGLEKSELMFAAMYDASKGSIDSAGTIKRDTTVVETFLPQPERIFNLKPKALDKEFVEANIPKWLLIRKDASYEQTWNVTPRFVRYVTFAK